MLNNDVEWVLAFDVGSKCTGYAFGPEGGELVKYGKYVAEITDSNQKGRRFYNFSKWVAKLVHSLPRKPTQVVIESPYYNRNVKTYAVLNKYIAIVQREVFRILQKETEFVSPKSVKASLDVPNGKTYKERKVNMVKFINKTYGLSLNYHASNKDKSDDDTADAIALLTVFCKRLHSKE